MSLTTDNPTPKTNAMCGYHNLEEYAFYQGTSKRELFILLRERSLNLDVLPHKDNWTDAATEELILLHKHGIK